ncbi:MAG: TerB family tellurite resistance protein [Alphaproteobacteria bacterium]|nr:TerB family tellurite resistance protein [Alphaproteobacteria bacterium]MCW5742289.1 TerB family tellurite resistance protein [Alphaproteobacteria bacterium]
MSIWGKILGGTAGIVIGGPIGTLLGAGGRSLDSADAETEGPPEATQQIAFTIGVIALGAKLARVDGQVTRREIDAFRSFFHVPPEEVENVGRFFDVAQRDTYGFETYARQVAGLFPDDPHVLEQVLVGLCLIAGADGSASPPEVEYLRVVAAIFGMGEVRLRRAFAAAGVELRDDPWAILGVMPDADAEELKRAHRQLALEYHPDRLMARGLPAEAIQLANRKFAAINAAYDRARAALPGGSTDTQ